MIRIFTFFTAFSSQLFAQFLVLFGRKYSVAVASILAFIATTVTFIFCIKQLIITAVALIVMPAWIATSIAWFIPTNFIAVTSAIISGRICKSAYLVITEKIKLVNNAS